MAYSPLSFIRPTHRDGVQTKAVGEEVLSAIESMIANLIIRNNTLRLAVSAQCQRESDARRAARKCG